MADPALAVTAQILEPSPARSQNLQGEHYPWVFTFTGEDVLELTSWNAAAGVRIVMQGRVYGAPGDVKPFAASHVPATNRSAVTTVHTVPLGELLNLVVYCESGTPLMGQTIVRVAVRRGAGAAFTRLGVLVQGPVTASSARAFPGSEVVSPLDVEPAVRTIVGTLPAVNVGITETVPAGARWELMSIRFTVTGVPNVNIGIQMFLDDGTNVFFQMTALYNPATAAAVVDLTWGGGQTTFLQAFSQSLITMCAPTGLRLLAGSRIRFPGGGPNNQMSAPVYVVREWLDI